MPELYIRTVQPRLSLVGNDSNIIKSVRLYELAPPPSTTFPDGQYSVVELSLPDEMSDETAVATV